MKGTVYRGRTHALRIARLKDGESMTSLCREFGISRVTGYKVYRHKECGLEGLTDRARTPYRYANKLPAQLEAMIVSSTSVLGLPFTDWV
jgi:leucine-zipper of insertion element IS481